MADMTDDGRVHERLPIRRHAPGAYRALIALDQAVEGVEPALLELVKLRVSQLNGCSFCIDVHSQTARRGGESERRLFTLSAWRETGLFTGRERAALGLAEAMTTTVDHDRVRFAMEGAAGEFSDEELANLLVAIAVINAWTRLGVASDMAPDVPELKAYSREVGDLLRAGQ